MTLPFGTIIESESGSAPTGPVGPEGPEGPPGVGAEYGTWTPSDQSGAGLTLTVSEARYVKMDKLVFLFFSITYPSTGNGSVAKVGGLPYPPIDLAASMFPALLALTTAAISRAILSDADGYIHWTDSTGLADATNAGMSTKTVAGVVVYLTS